MRRQEALAIASIVQGHFSYSRKKILAQTKLTAHEFLKEKELQIIKRVKIDKYINIVNIFKKHYENIIPSG